MNTGIQAYRRKDGYWVARIEAGWTPTGKRYRPAAVAKTAAEAKRKAKQMLMEYREGGQEALQGRNLTVAAWAQSFDKTHIATLKPKTQAVYRSNLRRWIVPTLGRKKISQLTPADVRALADAVRAAGNGSSTADQADRVLRTMLRKAEAEGVHLPKSVLLTASPGEGRSDRTAMPLEDARKVIDVLAARPDGVRWVISLVYALRQGEGTGLLWENCDFSADTIRIVWELQYLARSKATGQYEIPEKYEYRHLYRGYHLLEVKSEAGVRAFPMLPNIRDALLRWRDQQGHSPHGLVFPRPNGLPRHHQADRKEWQEIQSEAGVSHPSGRPWHVHETKHTAATLLDSMGIPEATRIKILGHATGASSRPYLHVVDADVHAALKGVSDKLRGDSTESGK